MLKLSLSLDLNMIFFKKKFYIKVIKVWKFLYYILKLSSFFLFFLFVKFSSKEKNSSLSWNFNLSIGICYLYDIFQITNFSGAVAERAKLRSYILLGCIVILIQALPSHWVWDSQGVFFKLGVVDFAGCSCVNSLY